MGKTCFTRGLARGLGIDPAEVSSPTFALVNEYRGGRLPLWHFDMYRVESFDALYSTGFFDYLDLGGRPGAGVERKYRRRPARGHHYHHL